MRWWSRNRDYVVPESGCARCWSAANSWHRKMSTEFRRLEGSSLACRRRRKAAGPTAGPSQALYPDCGRTWTGCPDCLRNSRSSDASRPWRNCGGNDGRRSCLDPPGWKGLQPARMNGLLLSLPLSCPCWNALWWPQRASPSASLLRRPSPHCTASAPFSLDGPQRIRLHRPIPDAFYSAIRPLEDCCPHWGSLQFEIKFINKSFQFRRFCGTRRRKKTEITDRAGHVGNLTKIV